MTCYELSLLIWYYTRPGDYPDLTTNPPIWGTTIDRLLNEHMLVLTDGSQKRTYELGERGTIFLEAVLKLPWPVQKWVIETPRDR